MERISSTLARANENLRRRVQERALSDVSTAGERQLMRQGSLNTLCAGMTASAADMYRGKLEGAAHRMVEKGELHHDAKRLSAGFDSAAWKRAAL